jgi:hypothetical protein
MLLLKNIYHLKAEIHLYNIKKKSVSGQPLTNTSFLPVSMQTVSQIINNPVPTKFQKAK